MRHHSLLLVASLLITTCAHAQLTRSLNGLRLGDEIIKQQVEYKEPGKPGIDRFWDFSELTDVNPEYTLDYSLPGMVGDTLYVMGMDTLRVDQTPVVSNEFYTMYYYLMRNDSLLQLGHENANTLLQYTKPLLVLKYPFNYGNVLVSNYESKGLYSGIESLHTKGTIRIEADAFGKMHIPNGDTLTVVRVKTTQLITEINDKCDSINGYVNRVMEIFQWYSKGYRYPVFESLRSIQLEDNITQFNTSFYFPPQNHYYLDSDPENVAILDSLWTLKNEIGQKPSNDDSMYFIKCSVYPNPVRDILTIDLELKESSPITLLLFNINGVILQNIRRKLSYSYYSETMDLSGLPSGIYYIKIVTSDSNILTKKVTKL